MNEDNLHYLIMPIPRLSDGTLGVRVVKPADIETIRQWRNAQMDVLRQTSPISPEEQILYFSEKVWPEMGTREPTQILLAIERDDVLIGYGGLVHISWPNRRAEISFLLSPELERDRNSLMDLFSRFLKLLEQLAFVSLGLRRLCTETFANRTTHISILESAGFRREGCMRQHVLIDGKPTDSIMHGLLACDWNKMDERH